MSANKEYYPSSVSYDTQEFPAGSLLLRLASLLLWPLLATWRYVAWWVRYLYLGNKIPGPKGWPLLGIALNLKEFSTKGIFDYFTVLIEQFAQKVPVTRFYIGPELFVFMNNPKDHEPFLSGYTFMHKGLFYKFLHPWLASGLLTSTGQKWRARRKALTPAFHFKIIDQFVPVFNSCSDEFILKMRRRGGGGGFDIWEDVKLLTLDVICETAMGVKMNAQSDSNTEYVNALTDLLRLTVERMLKPWFFFDWIYWMSPSGRKYKKNLAVLYGITDRVIRERKAELQVMESESGSLDADEIGRRRRVAFLDLLILMSRDGSLSDMDIREEVNTFMFEGHDTSSAGISFTIFLLSQHQDVQKKVYEELKGIFDTSKSIRPTISELSELKYLDMVIKESLRIYPPVTLFSRDVQQESTLPESKVVLPAGTSMFIAPYGLHRNPELYPEPEKFDPERFSPDECARRHPFAYIPFSAGPRNCIGQRFAMLEMKNVLAKLVWNFRILPEPGFEPTVVWEIILKSQNGIVVRLEERQRESN